MKAVLEKPVTICYHCGDSCADGSIHKESKVFCCQGCKMVYELLQESSLCQYYTLEENPGVNMKTKKDQRYAYLDDPHIQSSLLSFQGEGRSAVTFHIPSIHCSSCIWLLENLHKIHSGIIQSAVHFQRRELTIQFNSSLSLKDLVVLLSSIGYDPLITMKGKAVTGKSMNKALLYKLGIAGFCFGNIMMLSLPDYLTVQDVFEGEIKNSFTWLSLLLSLPVFFYSASGYFTSAWHALRNRTINIDLPIALGLTAAFSQSAVEIISGSGTGYLDSLTGLVFFLLIGKWYQSKTYEALSFDRDYRSYFPLAASKLANNEEVFVSLKDLQAGDVIVVRNQEIIPADGRLLSSIASIDYSFVTGESVPLKKEAGQQVFAGGRQLGNAIQIELTKGVSESYLTQLWNRDETKTKTDGLTAFTNTIGKYFTIAVLFISVMTYLYWMHTDTSVALNAAVSVLIIFCPCTLALAIPFCFGNAMNRLGRNGFYLKNTETIERLSNNNTIVFDKTGTITSGSSSEIIFHGSLTEKEIQCVKSLAHQSSHPLSKMLSAHLKDTFLVEPQQFTEAVAKGISGIVEGQYLQLGSAAYLSVSENESLPMTGSRIYVKINEEVKGYYTIRNLYRTGLREVITALDKNYRLYLLSGDQDADKMFLGKFFRSYYMRFQQSPSDKAAFVQWLSEKQKVLMIGDGLNDAGAFMQSHCSIGVTEKSAQFSPASDAILDAASFTRLPVFLKYAKSCLLAVYWSLGISLLYNIIGLFFAVQGLLSPLVAAILMPLSSVSVVLFVTGMSNALARKYRLK